MCFGRTDNPAMVLLVFLWYLYKTFRHMYDREFLLKQTMYVVSSFVSNEIIDDMKIIIHWQLTGPDGMTDAFLYRGDGETRYVKTEEMLQARLNWACSWTVVASTDYTAKAPITGLRSIQQFNKKMVIFLNNQPKMY
jgi:hypothetical protein